MRVENKKTIKVDELADLVIGRGGATWSALWQIFYYTRLFKYVHRKQFPKIKVFYNKITTDRNLRKLCELGYFKSCRDHVYCATNKVLPILEEAGYPVAVLPKEPIGNGDINELNNTEIFIQLTKLDYFYVLLFPQFEYLIPDALLLQLDSKKRRYKLTFIEVESKKPNWENYIDQKKQNYLKLSTELHFYKKWIEYCQLLKIPIPKTTDFRFTYQIYKINETN